MGIIKKEETVGLLNETIVIIGRKWAVPISKKDIIE